MLHAAHALLGITSLILAQPAPDPVEDGATWIRQNAIAFTTSEAGNGFEDLKGLGPLIGDATIVSLGEPTHGTREAFQMKHRLLEYLVEEKGFSIFSIEANMPESYALNQYVIEGKGDPKALIAGMYFWTWNTQEVLDMVEWMRSWNQRNPPETGKPRLQFTGFDMQTPDVAWKIGQDFITAHAPDLAEKNAALPAELRALQARASLGNTQGGWTSMTGSFPAADAAGKKLRFSAWIRTEDVTGWAGAWWRCDTPNGVQGFNNMEDKAIKGTTDWTQYEFTIDVPKDTNNINFGFILSGDGAAWFDDIEIELDGVRYEDPSKFSFDFENDAVKFLSGGSGEYKIGRVETNPRSGKKSLEIRRRPESEVPKVDAAAVREKAFAILRDLESRRDALAAKVGAKETDWAIQNVRIVSQCATMYASEQSFNARDEAMAANVRWILDQNPGQKIVLWAHNGHVSRSPYFGMLTMGSFLNQTHAKDMVVFGFVTGEGTYTAMAQGGGGLKRDLPLEPPPVASVEEIFTKSGLERAIVDIRSASKDNPGTHWAATQRLMRSVGALEAAQQHFPTTPSEAFDMLVWQARTTASRAIE